MGRQRTWSDDQLIAAVEQAAHWRDVARGLGREACGLTEWRGLPVPLQLDHVNGDRRDNRLENLRILCPNCHAQTTTYCGRNIGFAASGPGAATG